LKTAWLAAGFIVKRLLEIAKSLPEAQRDDLINQADALNALAGQVQTQAVRKEKKRKVKP
jgi:hypothetical protein